MLVWISRLQAVALRRGRVLEHRHRHLQPRQRRTQLVAGIGQQALVRAQQGLDARGGAVEAGAQRGHLVAAVLGHALVQRTGAEGLDALLQRLEPARQAPHHRVGAGGDGREQHQQQRGQAQARPAAAATGHQAPAGSGGPGRAPGGSRRPCACRHPCPAAAAGAQRRRTHDPQRAPVLQPHRPARGAAPGRRRLAAQVGLRRRRCAGPSHRPAPAAGAAARPVAPARRPARPAARRRRAASAAAVRPRPRRVPAHVATKRSRSCSKWRCNSQPETSANSASAATTVR